MTYNLHIEKLDNGFLCEAGDTDQIRTVIQEMDDENECLKKLLIHIAEYFGYSYDKFDSENLEISFTGKGHKVD